MHLVYYERDDAQAVADSLVAQGFSADLERVRFAGEDDDEDVSWALVTDAPEGGLAAFADEVECRELGWVETD